MAGRLAIHVIGPRTGESIILELPDGGVGVIDSFAARQVPHPVVSFLESRFPHLNKLSFFALTHPHADHCFRASDVIDRFPPEEVWVFRPFPAGQVQEYFRALQQHGTKDAVEEALDLPAGSVAESLLQLNSRISEPIRTEKLTYRPLAGHTSFTLCGAAVRFDFLTPCNRSQYSYAEAVNSAAKAIFKDGPTLMATGRLPQPDHNLASGAVLVRYGKTRILLMSDAEGPRWEEWLDMSPSADLCCPVHFIKTAHHGSSNGYLQRFYDIFGDPKVTVAVMTPFNQGNKHLPMAAGVQAIRPHVRDLYCTNRDSALASTGLPWVPVVSLPPPSLPATWANLIRRSRDLARLLVPETGLGATAGAPPPLPPQWVIDAHASPSLWRLIRPQHRLPIPAPSMVARHTISVFYDDAGNLLERILGGETGHLA